MIPFLGTLNIRSRIVMGTQKGTIILTATHMIVYMSIHMEGLGFSLLEGSLDLVSPRTDRGHRACHKGRWG